MEKLVVPFDVKQLSEDGAFTGVAAVYEVRDLNGDIIRRGAAKRSIQQNPEVPILASHDPSTPIGVGLLTDTDDGIEIKGQLELEVEKARDARALMKRRAYRGLSIGYDTIRRQFIEDEAGEYTRILEEIRVGEVSPVTNPAQPAARITEVKALTDEVKAAANFERVVRRVISYGQLLQIDVKAGRHTEPIDSDLLQAAADSLIALRDAQQEQHQYSDPAAGDPDQLHSLQASLAEIKSVFSRTT